MSFADYAKHGWKLCAIAKGKKLPDYAQWNQRPIPDDAVDGLDGAGLLHALSGTCALDLDSLSKARPWLAERGVDIDALLNDERAVRVESGRTDRSKLLYKLSTPLRTLKPTDSGLELRCATTEGRSVQDVLPPTVHPITKRPYFWAYGEPLLGDWRNLPPIPASLLALWRQLTAEAPRIEQTGPTLQTKALEALIADRDPDCLYDEWLKVGMAVHHETSGSAAGFAVWDAWSAKGQKYKGPADLKVHWLSFNSGGGKRVVTVASLRRESPAGADEFDEIVDEPGTAVVVPPKKAPRGLRQAAALGLIRNGSGKAMSNVANGERMIRNHFGGILWFDDFKDGAYIKWPEEEARPIQDSDYTRIQIMLQHLGLDQVQHSAVQHAVQLVARNDRRNCVKEWLDCLPLWDDTPRLNRMMMEAFGTPDDEYYRAAGRNWLIGMCARAYRPGCLVREVLVLEGEQYMGKSAALRMLVHGPNDDALPSYRKWYKELTADPASKDFEHQLRGVWLGEFPELHSVQRGAVERLKQFISNVEDHYRPPYGREPVDYPRRCSLVGTTNRDDWNRDETGGTRFMPIECVKVSLEWIAANREQLFAEARELFKRGEPWHHWPLEIAREKQAARATQDPWKQAIVDFVQNVHYKQVTVPQILDSMGISPGRQSVSEATRIGGALRALGFFRQKRQRVKQDFVTYWTTPPHFLVDDKDPLLL